MTPQPTPPAGARAKHAGGRPPMDPQKRSAYLHFRITPARKAAFLRAANAKGQTLIGWAFAHLDREAAYTAEGEAKGLTGAKRQQRAFTGMLLAKAPAKSRAGHTTGCSTVKRAHATMANWRFKVNIKQFLSDDESPEEVLRIRGLVADELEKVQLRDRGRRTHSWSKASYERQSK